MVDMGFRGMWRERNRAKIVYRRANSKSLSKKLSLVIKLIAILLPERIKEENFIFF